MQILSITRAMVNEHILKVSGELGKQGQKYVVTSLQKCCFPESDEKAQQTPKLSYFFSSPNTSLLKCTRFIDGAFFLFIKVPKSLFYGSKFFPPHFHPFT